MVDFELSDDQLALRDAARDLLDKRSSPERVRAHIEGAGPERPSEREAQPYDRSLWEAMVEQGWLGIDLPEAQGGLGLGTVEAAVLGEELGRHLAPVPLTPSLLALGALAQAAARGVAEAQPWVDRLLGGEAVGCVAWSRSPGAVTAAESGGGWTLTGRADPCVAAPVADVAVVPTAAGLFAVDLDATGTRPGAESAMDLTRPLGWLELDSTPALRLGGPEAVTAVVDHGAVVVSAELLGGAERVLEMTSQYAKERVQFGRPIGSFQAVKHRCADMLVDVEGMRSTVYYAAWCIGAGHPDASVAASTAKIWCADAAARVMASGLQVHGGIGFTWEHDLHLYLKRSQLDQVTFGDAPWHRERLAGLLRPRVEAGDSVI